jgi:hypothetical protein
MLLIKFLHCLVAEKSCCMIHSVMRCMLHAFGHQAAAVSEHEGITRVLYKLRRPAEHWRWSPDHGSCAAAAAENGST